MARNEEKAQSMLNRWIAYKRDEASGRRDARPVGKRPSFPGDVQDIGECEKWRMQILREVGKKIMEIQNESLGEQRIRDLNDEINKLMREKGRWEIRIIELGGPNYKKFERIADEEFGGAVTGADQKGYTYKYFGAAKNLPGVKDLFEKKKAKPKKSKYDYKGISVSYYGYMDDEDSKLERLEQEAEKRAIARTLQAVDHVVEETDTNFMGAIPTKEQMEAVILNKKKEDLIRKYASDQLIEELDKGKQEVEVVLGKK